MATFGGEAKGSCPAVGAPDGGGTNQSLGYPSSCGPPGTNQSSGPSSRSFPGATRSSIPSGGSSSGRGCRCTTMCGIGRVRGHCEGSVGSNGLWESNGIGSPADGGAGKEKGSRGGEPLFGRRIEERAGSPPPLGGARHLALGGDRLCRLPPIEFSMVRRRLTARERVTRRYARGWAGGLRAARGCGLA